VELGMVGVKGVQDGLESHGAVAMFLFLYYLMEVKNHVMLCIIMNYLMTGELRQFDSIVIEVSGYDTHNIFMQ